MSEEEQIERGTILGAIFAPISFDPQASVRWIGGLWDNDEDDAWLVAEYVGLNQDVYGRRFKITATPIEDAE